jgi:hypothetical protein
MTLQMKKYNNTKTIIAVSNKSAILVYVVSALMISTAAVYFIVASQDYSELSQSASSSDSTTTTSATTPESKNQGDMIATVNEMVFFIVVGVAYIAAGIWMLENKYYNKIPYIIAVIGSIALIAFYISTRTMNIPSIGVQDDIGTTDIISKILQAAIAGVSIYIVRSSTIIWRNATTTKTSLSAAEILEYQGQKTQKRRNHQTDKELDFSGHE